MKAKYIIAGVVIVAFVIFGAISFMQNNIEYVSASQAEKTHRTVQVKGKWLKDKESFYDPRTNTFQFSLAQNQTTSKLPMTLLPKGSIKTGCFTLRKY
jgi:hypothetical protein